MNICVSPYHLTGREAPAMAALALARRVVTLVPGVQAGSAGEHRELAQSVPLFGDFLKSWSWTVPLWRAGVLCTSVSGRDPGDDVWSAMRVLEQDESCAPLRGLLRQHDLQDRESYLHAVASDLLRGGPDPSISLPVAAGLDRFGARTGMVVARSHAVSVAQRAEAALGETLFSVTVPVFVQASARRILHYREVLADEVSMLGSAIERALTPDAGSASVREVMETSVVLSRAVASRRDELMLDAAEDEVRAVEGVVALSCVSLPFDAVITSSVRAWRRVTGERSLPHDDANSEHRATVPVLRDELAGRRVTALLVRAVGVSSRAR